MKVYRTSKEHYETFGGYLYLFKVVHRGSKSDYLCIDTSCSYCSIEQGDVIRDLADSYIEDIFHGVEAMAFINGSPLCGTFLFEHFLSTYSDPT